MATAFKVSLHLFILYSLLIGQGAVIMYQQHMLSALKANNIPATIRVRENSYEHPNGPASDHHTKTDDSRSDSSPPGQW